MKWDDIKAVLRLIGILLVAEGGLMGLCLVPAVHFADGTVVSMSICTAVTLGVGGVLWGWPPWKKPT